MRANLSCNSASSCVLYSHGTWSRKIDNTTMASLDLSRLCSLPSGETKHHNYGSTFRKGQGKHRRLGLHTHIVCTLLPSSSPASTGLAANCTAALVGLPACCFCILNVLTELQSYLTFLLPEGYFSKLFVLHHSQNRV